MKPARMHTTSALQCSRASLTNYYMGTSDACETDPDEKERRFHSPGRSAGRLCLLVVSANKAGAPSGRATSLTARLPPSKARPGNTWMAGGTDDRETVQSSPVARVDTRSQPSRELRGPDPWGEEGGMTMGQDEHTLGCCPVLERSESRFRCRVRGHSPSGSPGPREVARWPPPRWYRTVVDPGS